MNFERNLTKVLKEKIKLKNKLQKKKKIETNKFNFQKNDLQMEFDLISLLFSDSSYT